MRNVAKNFIYQSIFQVMKIIIPIITIPIVSKALGPPGVGLYNYTNSIAQYFVLVASLGVAMYGNREIALAYNRKENISTLFWELFFFKAIFTIAVLVVYLIVVSFFENRLILYVQGITILAVLFDISWFFMGIEDFKKTSICNLIVQTGTFLAILFFIKDSSDLLIYTFIQTMGLLLSQSLVWLFTRNYIKIEKISIANIFSHLKGSIAFFIPEVAILLYTNLNKTVLGIFLGSAAVGYYTNSFTINIIFTTVITTLDTVLLPHMSSLFAKDNIERIITLMEKTIHIQLFFSIPVMFGMLTVYDKLIPWFFGDQFSFMNYVVPLFSVLIVISPLGISLATQYLIPIGQVRKYNKSVIIGAVINMLGNLILLPIFGFFGVVFSNILAEFFVTFVRLRSFLKQTRFQFDIRKIIFYVISGLVMMVVTRSITINMPASLTTNIIQFFIAVSIYISLTSVLKVNPLIVVINGYLQENKF
ncbi:oligosaccharide flippase family protein [Enterococcus dongliensis]|uniref:Oligosaccharide flippase family protein n=1 Tax=Enterococcus dongliensis TaxID=2559925 RepID=A0AAW8TJI1_9ENTE|nr:oligosaccharide flippase family protein [Enterococcus dongliensis]MDT2597934.1 oligosaccharide flippase family protein [Enterococcus dongliensis]MDT2638456.1 oligosaccharide flippase family protein [Enterococcus dongliensis]MDT2640149.1 oligosaccharide flippase family protein [Enterococcus dongliensis]MDT2643607.1 oligosaccharide flippase family protein [Enterococcus dongliensis]MDT2648560.1 oligosaccharide flippase family protein [Enterococcus dongliensis]